ncbi:hypothetical protein ES707_13393 [subsurface metagenome]
MNYIERISVAALPAEGLLRQVSGRFLTIIKASHPHLQFLLEFENDGAKIPFQLSRAIRCRFNQIRIWDASSNINLAGQWIDLLISSDPEFDLVQQPALITELRGNLILSATELTAGVPTQVLSLLNGDHLLRSTVAWKYTNVDPGTVFYFMAAGEPLAMNGFGGTIVLSRDILDATIICASFLSS